MITTPVSLAAHALRAITVSLVFAAATLAGSSAVRADWEIGKTIPEMYGVQLKAQDMNAETIGKVQALGPKWVRRGFIWAGIEKEKGVYDFSLYDRFVADCKKAGLRLVAPIAFSNKLYGHVAEPAAREAYAKFAATLAERYKDEHIAWEIWNEPNTRTFWKNGVPVSKTEQGNTRQYAEEYTALVKATVPAMRKADPRCIILGGSVSNLWEKSFEWMEYCFDLGILKTGIDAWSVHPYGLKSPEDYLIAYGIMRGQMKKVGAPADFPVLNTERGFPLENKEGFAGGDPKLAREYQAWHLVRQYLIDMYSNIDLTIWYEWGGSESFALYSPKEVLPGFTACETLIKQLSGYKLDGRIKTESDRDFVLRFVNGSGASKLVAWAGPPNEKDTPDKIIPHSISIPVEPTGSLETVGIYGETGTIEVKNGTISLPIDGAPKYVIVKK